MPFIMLSYCKDKYFVLILKFCLKPYNHMEISGKLINLTLKLPYILSFSI